jgi:hypothetical protein
MCVAQESACYVEEFCFAMTLICRDEYHHDIVLNMAFQVVNNYGQKFIDPDFVENANPDQMVPV